MSLGQTQNEDMCTENAEGNILTYERGWRN